MQNKCWTYGLKIGILGYSCILSVLLIWSTYSLQSCVGARARVLNLQTRSVPRSLGRLPTTARSSSSVPAAAQTEPGTSLPWTGWPSLAWTATSSAARSQASRPRLLKPVSPLRPSRCSAPRLQRLRQRCRDALRQPAPNLARKLSDRVGAAGPQPSSVFVMFCTACRAEYYIQMRSTTPPCGQRSRRSRC